MDFVRKLETTIAGWAKNVPHLPVGAQKWIAENAWWIVLVGAILTGIGFLFALSGLFTTIAALNSVSIVYYVSPAITSWAIVTGIVSLVFLLVEGLLLAAAVNPLKARQKKGWTFLFLVWLASAASVIVNAILSLSVIGFIIGILFGAIGLAISGYFLFEIHGQFGQAVRPVKDKAVKKA
jgi:hypothetical protein